MCVFISALKVTKINIFQGLRVTLNISCFLVYTGKTLVSHILLNVIFCDKC